CAWFDPKVIAGTARRHAVQTDASTRFERGIDPMKLSSAIECAAHMIVDFCGGEMSVPRISGEFPPDGYPNRDNVYRYRPNRLGALAGVELPADEQAAILSRLEFLRLDPNDQESWLNEDQRRDALTKSNGDVWFVRAPTWRPDIDGEAD